MTELENFLRGNFDFFKAAIQEPALQYQASTIETGEANAIVSNLGAIEAAHLAIVGTWIGYFDVNEAWELISSSSSVLRAWSFLRSREIIPPEYSNLFQLTEDGEPSLNREIFRKESFFGDATNELVHNMFQSLLLVIAENILDDDSQYFLASIGWTDDQEWRDRNDGKTDPAIGSVRSLGAGFANVLNYLEEMESSADSAVGGPENRAYGRLSQMMHQILADRFNLRRMDIVERYFALAGDFANCATEYSPAWLDARQLAFDRLISIVTYARAGASLSENRSKLWDVFTKHTLLQPVENDVPVRRIKPQKRDNLEIEEL